MVDSVELLPITQFGDRSNLLARVREFGGERCIASFTAVLSGPVFVFQSKRRTVYSMILQGREKRKRFCCVWPSSGRWWMQDIMRFFVTALNNGP